MIWLNVEIKEEINNCYLYIFRNGKITEYEGTIRVYKGMFKKAFAIKGTGRVYRGISPVEGVVLSNEVWYKSRKTKDEITKRFKDHLEDENAKLQRRINKNNQILKEGFVCQMTT